MIRSVIGVILAITIGVTNTIFLAYCIYYYCFQQTGHGWTGLGTYILVNIGVIGLAAFLVRTEKYLD